MALGGGKGVWLWREMQASKPGDGWHAYLSDGLEVEPSQGAKDGKAAARLYEVCGELIAADRSPRRGRREDPCRRVSMQTEQTVRL